MKKKLIVIVTILMMLMTNMSTVWASSGSISVSLSKTSIKTGDTVKVTVKAKCGDGIGVVTSVLSYDSDLLTLTKNSAGSNFNSSTGKFMFDQYGSTSASYTFTFKAKKDGTASITVKTSEFIDANKSSVSGYSKSITKKVTIGSSSSSTKTDTKTDKKETISNDATLSALEVADFLFEEGVFDKETTAYTIYVPNGTTSLAITATANNKNAKLSTINSDVKEGWNQIDVVCTAQSGDKKTYTLNVYVEESPCIFYTLDDEKLGIVPNVDKLVVDPDFEIETISVDNPKKVEETDPDQISYNIYKKGSFELLYLEDDEFNKDFYIYDRENDEIISKYEIIIIDGRKFVKTSIDSDQFKDMESTFNLSEVTVGEYELDGWVYLDENLADFQVLYLSDEMGNTALYRYDKQQNTIQRYAEPEVKVEETYDYVKIGLAAFAGLMTLIVLIQMGKIKKLKKANEAGVITVSDAIVKDEPITETLKELTEEETIPENKEQLKQLISDLDQPAAEGAEYTVTEEEKQQVTGVDDGLITSQQGNLADLLKEINQREEAVDYALDNEQEMEVFDKTMALPQFKEEMEELFKKAEPVSAEELEGITPDDQIPEFFPTEAFPVIKDDE